MLEVRELSFAGDFTPAPAIGNTNAVLFGTATNNPTIGTINKGSSGAVPTPFYFNGDVAEMLIYDGQLSATDRAAGS